MSNTMAVYQNTTVSAQQILEAFVDMNPNSVRNLFIDEIKSMVWMEVESVITKQSFEFIRQEINAKDSEISQLHRKIDCLNVEYQKLIKNKELEIQSFKQNLIKADNENKTFVKMYNQLKAQFNIQFEKNVSNDTKLQMYDNLEIAYKNSLNEISSLKDMMLKSNTDYEKRIKLLNDLKVNLEKQKCAKDIQIQNLVKDYYGYILEYSPKDGPKNKFKNILKKK